MKASSARLRDKVTNGLRRGLLLGAAVLAACGGGTTQQTAFKPDRVIAFGDEASTLTATGRKYSINALAGDLVNVDCINQGLWVQALASTYGFVFQQCNPANATSFAAITRAAAGARVAELTAQIDAQIAAGGLNNKDLVAMLVGANDVLEVYAQFNGNNEAALINEARTRGDRYAVQVNRVIGTGARVIVATVPDLSFSPYALAQKAQFTDTDRAALIGRLVAAYNGRLRTGIVNDGRAVGLVLADEVSQTMARFPAAYGLANATVAACSAALPDCSTATLVTDATATTHLWADDRRLGPTWHTQVGVLAVTRALNNPF